VAFRATPASKRVFRQRLREDFNNLPFAADDAFANVVVSRGDKARTRTPMFVETSNAVGRVAVNPRHGADDSDGLPIVPLA